MSKGWKKERGAVIMRESSAIRVCVFLLAATAVAVTVNPGLRIAITDKGLEYRTF